MGTHFETCPDKMKTFAAIVLAFAAVAVQADPEFKACAGFEDNSYVDPWKLTINPDPIVAKEGASVSVNFDIKLKKNRIPLPCLPVPGLPISVGSCKYDANDLLALIPAEDCKAFAPAGQACALPHNPGFYGDKDPNGSKSLVLPEIPAIIKPFLSGKIAVEAKAMLDDGTEYLCIQNTLEVVTH